MPIPSRGCPALGVPYRYRTIYVKTGKSPGRPYAPFGLDAQRTIEWRDLYVYGWTLEEIGRQYGLTRERVRQMLKKTGMTRLDGGREKAQMALLPAKIAAAKERRQRMNNKFWKYGGVLKSVALEINGGLPLQTKGYAVCKFITQKKSAQQRGTPFLLTLKEWWDIWQESGHWKDRGRGSGYCMARWGDSGPYAIGNVRIILSSENSRESYLITDSALRFSKGRARKDANSFLAPYGMRVRHNKNLKALPLELFVGDVMVERYSNIGDAVADAKRLILP